VRNNIAQHDKGRKSNFAKKMKKEMKQMIYKVRKS